MKGLINFVTNYFITLMILIKHFYWYGGKSLPSTNKLGPWTSSFWKFNSEGWFCVRVHSGSICPQEDSILPLPVRVKSSCIYHTLSSLVRVIRILWWSSPAKPHISRVR